jgi:basic amino acid/polyamine antiporter, APA family
MATDEKQLMGVWMTSALVVGTMIGAGIFMLPVSLAPLGANAPIGWIVSSIGALCIAFALARLTKGGRGIQAYVEDAFGPTVGFLIAWAFWCSNWAAQAAVAIAAGSALSRVFPLFAGPDAVVMVAIVCVAFLTAVNALGARASGGMSILTVAIKLLPLIAVIALLGLRSAGGEPFEPLAPVPVTIANIATAVALTLFALTGFENATTPVNKVRNPQRTLPLALIGGTTFVALIYLLSSTGVTLLLSAGTVASSPAPYADALVAIWGEGAATLAALAIAISAFGALNGLILGTGELGYAMALRREMPAFMAKTRGASTPVAAQVVGSIITMLLVLAASSRDTAALFTFVILLSTAAILFVYLAGTLAAWRFSSTVSARLALVIAFLFILFAFYGSGVEANLWGLVLLAIGFAVMRLMRRLNSRAATPAAAAPAEPPGSSA